MKTLTPVRLRVEQNVITRIYRRIKGEGKLNVLVNQEVTPSDIIGEFQTQKGFRTLNISKMLSVSPKDVKKYLKKRLGETIYTGELLAFKERTFLSSKKIVTSPSDATLDFLNEQTGELKLGFLPVKSFLPAGVYGIVELVDNNKGYVLIKTQVSRVYGLFGTGEHRDGILKIIGRREDFLTEEILNSSASADQIIVGGSVVYKDVISSAISSGVSGIITGGINAKDYKSFNGGSIVFPRKIDNDIGISIVVCEGFGLIPIGLDIYKLLKEYDGKFVFIDGNRAIINFPSFESKSMERIRATALPKKEDEDMFINDYVQIGELDAGVNVRIIGNYFTGEQGKVLSIDKSESILPSGAKSILATVETSFKKIKIPVSNLEIIR